MAQKHSGSPRPGQKESNTPDNHAHDRLVFLFASFIVRPVLLHSRRARYSLRLFPGLAHNDHDKEWRQVHRNLLVFDIGI